LIGRRRSFPVTNQLSRGAILDPRQVVERIENRDWRKTTPRPRKAMTRSSKRDDEQAPPPLRKTVFSRVDNPICDAVASRGQPRDHESENARMRLLR
jgi:hypothetical protein